MSAIGELARCDGAWPLHVIRDEHTTYCGEHFVVPVIWPDDAAGFFCKDCLEAIIRPALDAQEPNACREVVDR